MKKWQPILDFIILAATLAATGAIASSDTSVNAPFWATAVLAVGSGILLQVAWNKDAKRQLWKPTVMHIAASIVVVWWLMVPSLPKGSAAFIGISCYAPTWWMTIKSSSNRGKNENIGN